VVPSWLRNDDYFLGELIWLYGVERLRLMKKEFEEDWRKLPMLLWEQAQGLSQFVRGGVERLDGNWIFLVSRASSFYLFLSRLEGSRIEG
jgi:hypothetical protein